MQRSEQLRRRHADDDAEHAGKKPIDSPSMPAKMRGEADLCSGEGRGHKADAEQTITPMKISDPRRPATAVNAARNIASAPFRSSGLPGRASAAASAS